MLTAASQPEFQSVLQAYSALDGVGSAPVLWRNQRIAVAGFWRHWLYMSSAYSSAIGAVRVFEIMLNFAGIISHGRLSSFARCACVKQLKRQSSGCGFKLPGAPSPWLTLLFFTGVSQLRGVRLPGRTYTIARLSVFCGLGWFGVRRRVAEIHSTAPSRREMKNRCV